MKNSVLNSSALANDRIMVTLLNRHVPLLEGDEFDGD